MSSSSDSNQQLAKSIIESINKARTSPSQVRDLLNERLTCFEDKIVQVGNQKFQTQEGSTAVDDCKSYFEGTEAVSTLESCSNLTKIAEDHADYLSKSGETGHSNNNGENFLERLKAVGKWKGQVGELLAFQYQTANEFLLHWLINDGLKNRGDRLQILNSEYRKVGVAVSNHKDFGLVAVVVFVREFTLIGEVVEGYEDGPMNNEKLEEELPEDLKKM